MTALRHLAGSALYRLYHAPLGRLEKLIKAGGPWVARKTERGQREMEAAARSLAPLPTANSSAPLVLHLLTGKKFWYQSAFCLYSFSLYAKRDLTPIFYDDGTLAESEVTSLQRLFPQARFVRAAETQPRLDTLLPREHFPVLRERWDNYPNLRKLTDPHLGAQGWKLVLDSDLLFFRTPEFLINWLEQPTQPLHAVDAEQSYGYSAGLLRSLAKSDLADRVNVGLCGLQSESLDWVWVENVCRVLLEREGPHYYLEQALVAILVAGQKCAVAPESEYVTLPLGPEVNDCRAIMHHYVAGSKRWYFQQNWRRFSAQ